MSRHLWIGGWLDGLGKTKSLHKKWLSSRCQMYMLHMFVWRMDELALDAECGHTRAQSVDSSGKNPMHANYVWMCTERALMQKCSLERKHGTNLLLVVETELQVK